MSHRLLAALWCAVVLALAPAARAGDAPYRVDLPAGWEPQPDQARRIEASLSAELASTPPIPDLPMSAEVQSWRGADAALVVTWLRGSAPADPPEPAIRALLDRTRDTPAHAALEAGDTEVLSWREDVTGGVADARLAWQHLRNDTTTVSRALGYATPEGRPMMIRADCMTASGSGDDPAAAACEQVLASLALTVPADARAPLAALPPGRAAELPAETAGEAQSGAAASGAAGSAAQRGDRRGELPPAPTLRAPGENTGGVLVMQPAAREERSSRWLYVLGGALVLAGLYFTLRSRRDENEGEGENENADRAGTAAADDEDEPDDQGAAEDGAPDAGTDEERS